MVVIAFLVTDKVNWERFVEETFLLANVSPEVVIRIFFLTLNGANINYLDWELWWRTYTTKKALLTTKHVKLVEKKDFAVAALDLEYKTFIVHIVSLSSTLLDVYPSCRAQISGLIAKKAPTKVSDKYVNFADVFSLDLMSKLLEHTEINDYAIELVDD